jgi:hypothetical protein
MSALSHFLPQFTRPDVFFGVTVDPAFPTIIGIALIVAVGPVLLRADDRREHLNDGRG